MFKVAINLRATVNCLVTNVFRNIFCFQQKKVTHTGLEQVEGEYRTDDRINFLGGELSL